MRLSTWATASDPSTIAAMPGKRGSLMARWSIRWTAVARDSGPERGGRSAPSASISADGDGGERDDAFPDRALVRGHRQPDRPGSDGSEPEPVAAEPDESAIRERASERLGDPQHLVDRQCVRGPRADAPGMRRELGQRQRHDLARLDPHDRVEDQAGRPPRDVDEVGDVELLAAADLEALADVLVQGREDTGDGGERGAIVATVGGATDEESDGWRRHGHDASSWGWRSTERSRKWVAHEMHGS